MHISPKKKTGEYFGFYDSFFALGYAVGPLIGGFLLTGVPDNIFDFMIIMSLISFSVAYLGISEKRKHTKFLRGLGSMIRKDKIFIADLKEYKKLGKAGVIIIYFSMLFAVWEGFIWGFVPLFSERVFTTMIYGGMMLTAFALPYVLFQLPSGFLADRYGKRRFMSLGFFVAGLFSILISMTTEPMLLISFAFLAAAGMAIASPNVIGFLTDISIKEKRGEISGVRAFAEDIGFVIGPMAGGALIYSFGFGNTFVIFGILLFISAVLSLLAKRKR
jgi:MFS family permease